MGYQSLHCITGSSNGLFAKKYEYSFKQTYYVGERGTVDDCSNRSTCGVFVLWVCNLQ